MKLYPPFGKIEHWITQTTHGESAANPKDWSKQKAEDWSAPAGRAVYAGVAGKIVNISSSAGTYLTLDPGSACPFWILYVHCKPSIGIRIGSVVKRGQRIATTIAPYGHLHLACKNKNYRAPHPEPMSYLDRTMVIKTRYSGIAAMWFKAGKFNWSLFADRQVPGTPDPIPVKTCAELLAEQKALVKTLQKQVAGLNDKILKLNKTHAEKINDLNAEHQKALAAERERTQMALGKYAEEKRYHEKLKLDYERLKKEKCPEPEKPPFLDWLDKIFGRGS